MNNTTFLFWCSILLVACLSALTRTSGESTGSENSTKQNEQHTNKVRYMLDLLLRKSKDTTYWKDEFDRKSLDHMNDKEVLRELCGRMNFVKVCEKSIEALASLDPERLGQIVKEIRSKSGDENGRRLLRHKLIEWGVTKIKDRGYDEDLNNIIDLLATRSPFMLAFNKILNTTIKLNSS